MHNNMEHSVQATLNIVSLFLHSCSLLSYKNINYSLAVVPQEFVVNAITVK